MHESNSLIEFSNTMLAHVAKHFNYNIDVVDKLMLNL